MCKRIQIGRPCAFLTFPNWNSAGPSRTQGWPTSVTPDEAVSARPTDAAARPTVPVPTPATQATAHIAQVAVPDEVVVHRPGTCEGCGADMADADLI